ncbi:Hypothetical_protein [Hexamita inflata]|uniref:Hypothetical_protein n=1 Tax=Hexamita inflata TaxID=28002 RepID=A0AA86NUP3_9EUKA|nr:Hypothetical protein HINF_LOCUS14155 [Hexamita inflata]
MPAPQSQQESQMISLLRQQLSAQQLKQNDYLEQIAQLQRDKVFLAQKQKQKQLVSEICTSNSLQNTLNQVRDDNSKMKIQLDHAIQQQIQSTQRETELQSKLEWYQQVGILEQKCRTHEQMITVTTTQPCLQGRCLLACKGVTDFNSLISKNVSKMYLGKMSNLNDQRSHNTRPANTQQISQLSQVASRCSPSDQFPSLIRHYEVNLELSERISHCYCCSKGSRRYSCFQNNSCGWHDFVQLQLLCHQLIASLSTPSQKSINELVVRIHLHNLSRTQVQAPRLNQRSDLNSIQDILMVLKHFQEC